MSVLTRVAALIKASDRVIWISKLFTAVVFPIFEGFLVNLLTSNPESNILARTLIIIAVVHFCLAIIILFEQSLPSTLLTELEQAADEIEDKDDDLAWTTKVAVAFQQSVTATSACLVQIADMAQSPEPELKKIIDKILDPWISARSEIFFFENGDAFYNFAFYQANEEGELLLPVSRIHDDRLVPTNRIWMKGDGHVGTCFLRKERVFLSIPPDEEITDALRTTQPRAEDSKYYRSMLANPIWVDDDVKGVLIITSSVSDQFEPSVHLVVSDVMASLLGLAIKDCWRKNDAHESSR